MNEKTVLQCEFRDFLPSMEIIGELSQAEYQASKKVKTSKFNKLEDSQDDEYLIGGWDVIEITPTKTITRKTSHKSPLNSELCKLKRIG